MKNGGGEEEGRDRGQMTRNSFQAEFGGETI